MEYTDYNGGGRIAKDSDTSSIHSEKKSLLFEMRDEPFYIFKYFWHQLGFKCFF